MSSCNINSESTNRDRCRDYCILNLKAISIKSTILNKDKEISKNFSPSWSFAEASDIYRLPLTEGCGLLSFNNYLWPVDMAAMLSGGQRLGLLSTTLNNTSSAAGLHEFGNGNFEGLNEPNLGNSRKPGGNSNTKSVVLVKLTDSALKAITEYVKERVSFQDFTYSI